MYIPVTPVPDVLTSATMISTSTSQTASNTAGRLQSIVQKIKDFVTKQQHHVQNFINKNKNHFQKIAQSAFMFGQFMKTVFMFFPIIILVRMIIGIFQKPLEFIMMGMSIIILSIIYVIYYIFSLYPLIYIPYIIWYILFDVIRFVLYSIVILVVYLIIILFCIILALINFATGGALKNMVLCQNSPYSWYFIANNHLNNKYQRSLFCSKPCLPGYYPDAFGSFCIKNNYNQPSFCPYAEIMRLHTNKKNDINYYYKDYNTLKSVNYMMATPQGRESLLKSYYLNKINFINDCETKLNKYKYVSLAICSSLDSMSSTEFKLFSYNNKNIDPITLNKIKTVCSQAFCNTKNNYPFCSFATYSKENDKNKIKDIIILIINISIFFIICAIVFTYFNKKNFYVN